MQFNDYQAQAAGTAQYPDAGHNLIYPALGLTGEAGETADKIKKLWRNEGKTKGIQLTKEQRDDLLKEIGDVLWYCAAITGELCSSLDEVAHMNLKKLYDRQIRSVIKSAGDNR